MRIRIIFGVQNRGEVIPFFHQPLIHNLISGLLYNSEYSNFKGFTFSNLKGAITATTEGLKYTSSKATIIVSSFDSDFINHLIYRVKNHINYSLGRLNLIFLGIEEEPAFQQFESSMKFISLSPLLPNLDWKIDNQFIDPYSDTFSDCLYESTMQRMEEFKIVDVDKLATFNKFQIVPDKEYLERQMNDPSKYARFQYVDVDNASFKIRVYSFPFTLFAEPEVQEFIYNSGMGELNHLGLGMVDLIRDQNNNG